MPIGSSRAAIALLAALPLGACVSQGQSSPPTTYGFRQSVLSGRLAEMGDYNTISGDGVRTCHLQPLPTVRILTQPAHGEVLVTTGTRVLHTRPDEPLAHCGGRPFASRIVQYRPVPGYRGEDRLSYSVTFANGMSETYEKAISVN
jgi:hypothetical protein